MNKGIKKAMLVGMAGVTLVNSMPLSVLAQGVNTYSSDLVLVELGNMMLNYPDGSVTLSLVGGKSYYSESKKKVFFTDDAVFNLVGTFENDIEVSSSTCTLEKYDKNSYRISNIKEYLDLIITFSDSSYTFNGLEDFVSTIYGDNTRYEFVSSEVSLGLSEVQCDGMISGKYFNGSDLTYSLSYDMDGKLGMDLCDFVAYFNGVLVPSDSISVDTQNKKINVSIDVTNEAYGVGEDVKDLKFLAEFSNIFGSKATCSEVMSIDSEAPVVSKGQVRYVEGMDGNVYYDVDEQGNVNLSFNVSDSDSGVKSVKIMNGSEVLPSSFNNGVCLVKVPNNGDCVVLDVFVEDNVGNSKTYRMSELFNVSSDKISFGIPVPIFNFSVVGGEKIGDWYKGEDVQLGISVTNEIGGVSKFRRYLNDYIGSYQDVADNKFEEVIDLDSCAATSGKGGLLSIGVSVLDSNGNEFNHVESYKVDGVAPSIENIDVENKENYYVYGDTAFLNKEVKITGVPIDNESGVKSVEILLGGEVVGNSLPFSDGRNGEYVVRVTDNVGNFKDYSLGEIVGKDFKNVFISKKFPIIGIKGFTEDSIYIDGTPWYKSIEKLDFTIDSDNIKEVIVTNEATGDVLNCITEDNRNYYVPLDSLEDGVYNLSITAKAKNGNESKEVVQFGIDSAKPVVKDSVLSGVYGTYKGNVYFKDSLNLKVSIEEVHSGLSRVELLDKNGKVISENISGEFTISDSGEYSIRVVDKLGNETVATLGELLDLESNNFVLDMKAPLINYNIPKGGLGKDSNIFGQDIVSSISVEDVSSLKSLSVICNGKEIHHGEGKDVLDFDLNTSNYEKGENGLYNIEIVAEDLVGNLSKVNYSFYIDTIAPSVEKVSIEENYISSGNFLWFKKVPEVIVNASDNLVDVKKYIVLNEDGTFRESNSNKIFLKDGDYAVRVEDAFGNSSEAILFKDSESVEGGIVSIDSDKPVIDCKRPEGDLVGWFDRDVEYVAKLSDNKGIREAKITVNGVELATFKSNDRGVLSKELKVNTSEVKPDGYGKYTIKVVVEDYSGNKSSWSDTIYVDKEEAYFTKAEIHSDYKDNGYGVFFKSNPVIKVEGEDKGIGLKEFALLDDEGNVVFSNDSGEFTLSTGRYSVRVEDRLGQSTTKTLQELLGLSSNYIVVDEDSPVISTARPDRDVDGWFSSDVEYAINISDKVGLYSGEVLVNGVVVDSFAVDSGEVKDKKLKADTSKVKCNKDLSYDVDVRVVDNSGNRSEWKDKIFIDRENPYFTDAKISLDHVGREYGAFFKSKPEIIVHGKDDGIGIDSYYLLDKEGNVVEVNKTGKFILKTGEYSIKVSDKLGHSITKTVQELLGLKSNSVVVDGTSPVISTSRPSGDIDGWFSKDVEYSIRVSDGVGLYSGEVYINGVLVDSFSSESSGDLVRVLKANTSEVDISSNNQYQVLVKVSDNSGNYSEWEDTIFIDREEAYFSSASITSGYKERDYGVFFKSSPVVDVVGNDNGVGLKSYSLLDMEGNLVEENTTGKFVLSSGEYLLKVEDMFGQSTTKSVQELLGLSSNCIVIDGETPIIETSRPSGDINGWYSGDVEYSINLYDSIGLYSGEVSINGVVIDSFKVGEGNQLSKSLKADTSKVVANTDGSYEVVVKVEDNSGNSNEWRDIIHIDRESPVVDRFIITSNGYKEGSEINGSDKYGFYIKDSTNVDIYVSDGAISSGMDKVYYTLRTGDNLSEVKGVADIVGGVASVRIPKNFKGFISAYATDKVGNKGSVNRPDGIISEDSNVHVNTSSITLSLPFTEYVDGRGYSLYGGSVDVGLLVVNKTSGIRSVEWGIGDKSKGIINIDKEGNVVGDVASVGFRDKNLVVSLSDILGVSDNTNELRVWTRVVDRVGHVSESSKMLSIDKDAPIIDVSYNENLDSNYYDSNRVATVRITERNFNPSEVQFSGKYGTVGSWKHVGGDMWSAEVVFSEDADYQWSIDYTDMAGNKGTGYSSEKFTIDKTNPVLNVSFDNNSVENTNFYKDGRTATISVVEKNFKEDLVKLEGSGVLSGWRHDGDKHTATISFNEDGEYDFSLTMSDLAGNTSNIYNSGKFTIDKSIPKLDILGVQNGVSYKKGASFRVVFGDKYLDSSRCSARLVGRTGGSIELTSSFNAESGEYVFEGLPEDIKYDDLYSLEIMVYDKAGNVAKENLSFSINRFGSQYRFVEDLLLNNVIGEASDVNLEEISVDRLNIDECRVVVIRDGNIIDIDDSLVSVKESGGVSSPWVYKYHIDKKAFNEDGKYQVQVFSKAFDGKSNSSLVQEYAFLLDTSNPEIIISGIKEGEFYKGVSKKVSIDVRDLSGVDSIEAILNGEKINLLEENGVYYLTVVEGSESQNLEVIVVDKAGNRSFVRVEDFLISSSTLQSIIHSSWFRVVSGLFVFLLVGLLALIGYETGKDRKHTKKVKESITEDISKE